MTEGILGGYAKPTRCSNDGFDRRNLDDYVEPVRITMILDLDCGTLEGYSKLQAKMTMMSLIEGCSMASCSLQDQ